MMLHVKAEVTKDQSREQNSRHSESDSTKLEAGETQPDNGNHRNQKNRISDRIGARIFLKPFHTLFI